jgi:hypothetical protein
MLGCLLETTAIKMKVAQMARETTTESSSRGTITISRPRTLKHNNVNTSAPGLEFADLEFAVRKKGADVASTGDPGPLIRKRLKGCALCGSDETELEGPRRNDRDHGFMARLRKASILEMMESMPGRTWQTGKKRVHFLWTLAVIQLTATRVLSYPPQVQVLVWAGRLWYGHRIDRVTYKMPTIL